MGVAVMIVIPRPGPCGRNLERKRIQVGIATGRQLLCMVRGPRNRRGRKYVTPHPSIGGPGRRAEELPQEVSVQP